MRSSMNIARHLFRLALATIAAISGLAAPAHSQSNRVSYEARTMPAAKMSWVGTVNVMRDLLPWQALLAMALCFVTASCARTDLHVREVPNIQPAADDPAVSGRGLNPTLIRPAGSTTPADEEELPSPMQWSPVADFDLNAGESRSFRVVLPKQTTIFVRVLWSGAAGPVSVVVTKASVTIATGAIYTDPPDRGDVIAQGIAEAGDINVSVHNNGKRQAKVQAIWGTLVEERP